MYEQQRDSMANQAFNMEQTVFTLDTIKNTQSTVATMKQAAEQLKVENKKINIDEIDDLNDDLQDLFEDIGEITETLGRSYEIPGGCDEEDLEAELAMLQDDFETDEIDAGQASQYLNTPSTLPVNPNSIYPNAPSEDISTGEEVDEYGLPLQQKQTA